MSDKPVPVGSKLTESSEPESSERPKSSVCKSKEQPTKMKEQITSEKTVERTKVATEAARVRGTQQTESPRDNKDFKLETCGETVKVCETQQTISANDKKQIKKPEGQKLEVSGQDLKVDGTQKMEFLKGARHVKDVKSNTANASKKPSVENMTVDEDETTLKIIPIFENTLVFTWNAAVPRIWPPLSMPNLNQRPLVLATHLVPSLPIELFQILAEIFESVTKKPVVLLNESRTDRPVAKDIVDIAILPAVKEWDEGVLLPASFVFEHYHNKNNSPYVYAEIIAAADCAAYIKDIMDLRGYRCAVPDRRNPLSAAGLLFNHLHTKGESPAFFGSILDATSQLAVLQMVAGKQAEVGVLESTVVRCQVSFIPSITSLHTLGSLGPLPPYRIMINRMIADRFVEQLTTYLLNINQQEKWMERLLPFGIVGFAENSENYYDVDNKKSVVTNVPYY
ncbi:hypothetical protein DMN91_010191 [Ooceraea biroi]|uniref:Uncharacterized protein n=1 Tax=Ooceraea biroi TaxID=2015173 RepID=A0A026W4K4_OOCBI|nr:uncharacterized protein LOC105283757 [Ooceraea biroi]EZA50526.1 hypothetical protein X777_10719 [Ooceraea biroi]RLU17951.1 hypothetical protein DMN91_010191 [Ooceraea biroi]